MAHIPVLLNETMEILCPKSGERILDCTFGGGGHTQAILDLCDCFVCAIDRDPDARQRASTVERTYSNRFEFIPGNFSEISTLLQGRGKFNAVLFDFGISSFQIDDAERGFSFLKDATLDMRMSRSGVSAYDVINSFTEEELADIIWAYGDEPLSRKIAAAVVQKRKVATIKTTIQLADIVRNVSAKSRRSNPRVKIDAATKTFQAIRIFVNDELRSINDALMALLDFTKDGARLAFISFHSLEDKIVKNWAQSRKKYLKPINRSVIRPTDSEISSNPRSRSAVLRGFLYNEFGVEDITEGEAYE